MDRETASQLLTIKRGHTVLVCAPNMDCKFEHALCFLPATSDTLQVSANSSDQWAIIPLDQIENIIAEDMGRASVTTIIMTGIVRQ